MKARNEHRPEVRQPARAGLYDIVFALNVGLSYGYGLLVCVIERIDFAPPDDLYYVFRRAAARINDVLLLNPAQVTISDMERHYPTVVEQLSRELVLLVSVFAATTGVCLLLKIIAGTRLHRVLTTRVLGPSLLFAAPLSYLAAMHNMSWDPDHYWVPPFWDVSYRSLVLVLAAEAIAAVIVSRATAARSGPLLVAFWLLHFGFWVPVLWSVLPPWLDDSYVGYFAPRALLTGWLTLALIWALRLRRGVRHVREVGARGLARTVSGAIAAAMAAFIWLPHPTRSVADPSDRGSVTVEVSRGRCYDLPPRHSVRIHGNGSIENRGFEFVSVRGQARTTLSPERVATIHQKLDSVGFFGIEDRAFDWGWHTGTIAVIVTVGGATHCVSSDVQFAGARSGTQARFVQAALEIDRIISVGRWVE
jgi:hypothetical protein